MAVYLMLFVVCFVLSFIADKSRKNKTKQMCLILCVILLSFFAGLRDIGVGTDTDVYTMTYFNASRNFRLINLFVSDFEYDRGYFFLNYLANIVSSNYHTALFLTQFLSVGTTYWGIYKLSQKYNINFTLYTFLYCFIFYNQTYNYMRQSCAMGILIIAFYFFLEKKYLTYLFLQLCSFFFHSTSLLFIIVPLYYVFSYKRIKPRIKICVSVIGVLFLFWIVTHYYEVLSWVASHNLIGDIYGDRYGMQSEYLETNTFNGSMKVLMVFPLLMFTILYLKKAISSDTLIFMSLLHFSYFAVYLLSLYIMYLLRLSFYFYYIELVFIAIILNTQKINLLIKWMYFIVVIYNWYMLYIVSNQCETYPYKSHILGI